MIKDLNLNNELIDIYINSNSSNNRLGKYSTYYVKEDTRIKSFLSTSVKPIKDVFFDLFESSLNCKLAYPSFILYLRNYHFDEYSLYLQRLAFYRSISLLIEFLNINNFNSLTFAPKTK